MPVKLKHLRICLRQGGPLAVLLPACAALVLAGLLVHALNGRLRPVLELSLIHISEPTRLL